MSCEAFKFCPGCGQPIEHRPPELTTELRKLRMAGAGPYIDKCIEVLNLLKTEGPLSAVQCRQIGRIHLPSAALHYCGRAGLAEKLPTADGEHAPRYRLVEG